MSLPAQPAGSKRKADDLTDASAASSPQKQARRDVQQETSSREAQSVSPHHPSASLLSLADVELQLCLQSLDNRSRVMTARCSCTLLNAASHSFAWLHAETVIVTEFATKEVAARLKSAASLQRLAPLLYRAPAETGSDELKRVLRLDNLTGLDLSRGPTASAEEILPSLLSGVDAQQRVRHLTLRGSAVFSCAARMPSLTSLSALQLFRVPNLRDFASASTLTSLSIGLGGCRNPFLSLEAFSALRVLRLAQARWVFDDLAEMLLAAPRVCATLQHLALLAVKINNTKSLADALPSLVALHTLELRRVTGLSAFLGHLPRAPQMRCLMLHADDCADRSHQYSVGSVANLQELLQDAPLLHIRLTCSAEEAETLQRAVTTLTPPTPEQGMTTLYEIASLPHVRIEVAHESDPLMD